MGFQALAFFMAFALPALLIGPISDKPFTRSTKWLLAIIAASIGAIPLVLVPFTGAFSQYLHVIQICYVVYAVAAIGITGYSSTENSAPTQALAEVPAEVRTEDDGDGTRRDG